jgi:LAGLIDADG-like domain/Transposase IS116/IS110/IS902 family
LISLSSPPTTQEQTPESVAKIRKDLVRAWAREGAQLSTQQARWFVDTYYQIQDFRIQSAAQLRTASKEEDPLEATAWVLGQFEILEKELQSVLGKWAAGKVEGRWAQSITGIGPVLSAGLCAHIDITQAPTVGHIWRFAGLDPTVKWNKNEKRPWNARLKVLCVRPDQRVTTRRGYIPIQEVQVGDEVLTHLGRFRPVTEVFINEHDGVLVRNRLFGRANVAPWLTPEHPVLAQKRRVIQWIQDGRPRWKRGQSRRQANYVRAETMRAMRAEGALLQTIADAHGVSLAAASVNVRGLRNASPPVEEAWVGAGEVQIGWDMLAPRVSPEPAEVTIELSDEGMLRAGDSLIAVGRWAGVAHPRAVAVPAKLKVDAKIGRLIGLYAAEGHVSGNHVGWSFNIEETELAQFVVETLAELGIEAGVTRNEEARAQQVIATRKALAQTFGELFGHGAYSKRLPMNWLWQLSDDVLRAVVEGTLEGDGHIEENGTRVLGVVSERLARWVADAIGRLGDQASIGRYTQAYHGRSQVVWKVMELKRGVAQGETGAWHPIMAQETDNYTGPVYNLEVEEDHSYVVEGIAVHNCWKLGDSFVKQKGRESDVYGKVYAERKAWELERNERGLYAAQAAASLAEKRITDKDLKATYEAGKLPLGRIELRARRYAVKLFLSHFHWVSYQAHFGTPPPKPFVIERLGHAHFIAPPNWPLAE